MTTIELSEVEIVVLRGLLQRLPRRATGRPRGLPDSEAARQNRSAGQRRRYQDPTEREKTRQAVKRAIEQQEEAS